MRSSISRHLRRLALALALVLCAVIAAPRAHAADKREQARKLLVEGAASLQSGEYAQALAKFEAGYELVPSPKIHYNLGQAYDGLGRFAEALTAFRRFLAEARDAAPANVAKAKRMVATLEGKVALLEVGGDVLGAEVVSMAAPMGRAGRRDRARSRHPPGGRREAGPARLHAADQPHGGPASAGHRALRDAGHRAWSRDPCRRPRPRGLTRIRRARSIR